MSTLAFDYIDATITPQIMKVVENQSMRSRPILRKMKENALKTGASTVVQPLSYSDHGANVKWLGRGGNLNLSSINNMAPAKFEQKLLAGTMTIWEQDQLLIKENPGLVVDFMKVAAEDLVNTIDMRMAMRMWDQSSTGTNEIDGLTAFVGTADNTIGGIDASTYKWWNPKVIAVTSDEGGDYADAHTETGIKDPTKKGYILNLFQMGLAKAGRLKGNSVTDIVAGQYHLDLVESILDPRKTGSMMDEQYAKWGFTAFKFRNVAIVPDEDLIDSQLDGNSERYSDGTDKDEDGTTITASSDADIINLNGAGRIFFLSMPKGKDYLRFCIHPSANWSMKPWQALTKQVGMSRQVTVGCTFKTSCRAVHACLKEVYSPVKYSR